VGIFIFQTLFGYAQTYTQLRTKNVHRGAWSVVLELTKKPTAVDVRPIPQV